MNGSNPNKFDFILFAAPIDPTTGRTVTGLKRTIGVFRTYDKASIHLDRMYLKQTEGEETFWIANRLKTRKRKT